MYQLQLYVRWEADLSHHFILPSQHLHLEVAIGGVYGVGLVHHAGNAWVLVYEDLSCGKM